MAKRIVRAKLAQPLVSPDNAKMVPEGKRGCPICKAPMQTQRNEAETIDVCEEHGVWLDRFELERMFLARARRRARMTKRQVGDAFEKGQLDGWFWGLLA